MAAKDHSLLIQKLHTEGLLDKNLKLFELLSNSSRKLQFAENLLKEHNLLPDYDQFKLEKYNKKVVEFVNSAKQLYKKKNFYCALVSCNKGLSYSPEDSQNVGIGYGNRSTVYFAMGQYEKCLENIELAKNHNYLKEKIEKLNKQKEQAIENLNNCPDPNQKLIKYKAARERFLKPELKGKENLNFFAADCLEVKTSPEFGRHLITNEDLKVGSVIAVEKPFSKVLNPEAVYERCANCLKKNLLNLLPCFNCCSAMFCSEDCRSAAQKKFHKFECGLINAIHELFLDSFGLALRTYFEALHICETPSKLREFLNSIKDSNATILDFEYTDEASHRKNLLHSIDTLMTFEKSETSKVIDRFQFTIICAIICNLMLNHSEPLKALLLDEADQDVFREFIFKYSQISTMNFYRMHCPSMFFTNQFQDEFGSASYPFCSLINHSCAPNVVRENFETSMYIVVKRPIKKGQQIFDNYGVHHAYNSLQERQKELIQHYHFKCYCEACKDDNNYPTFSHLKNGRLYETLEEDTFCLREMQDLDVAVKNYDKYCQYIDEFNEKDYPSREIIELHNLISISISIFSTNETYEKFADDDTMT